MWKVNIYIETSSAYQAEKERRFGFILECRKKDGDLETRDKFFKDSVTYHQATLHAVLAALKKIKTTCEICIHTENGYAASRLNKLPELMTAGFKDTKGKDIKNIDLWMQVCSEAKEHIITARTEKHSYSGWMKRRMEELESEERRKKDGIHTTDIR